MWLWYTSATKLQDMRFRGVVVDFAGVIIDPMSKRKAVLTTRVRTGAKHTADALEPTDPYVLRAWQAEARNCLRDARRRRLIGPTGAGKGPVVKVLACEDATKGMRVIVAYPTTEIKYGYIRHCRIKVGGKILAWEPWDVGEDATYSKSATLEAVIKDKSSGGEIILCTHSTLRTYYARALLSGNKTPFRNCSVYIDEGHHSEQEDENNRLGDVIDSILSTPSAKLLVATATWLRCEKTNVIRPQHLKRFTTYQLSITRYMKEIARIEEVHFRYVIASPLDGVRAVLKESKARKTLSFLPLTGSREAKELLLAQIKPILKDHRIKHVDLVADDSERESRLSRFIRSGQDTTDMLLCLNKGTEGFDWPACSRILVLRARRSIPQMIQMLGRALRYFPGKCKVEFTVVVSSDDLDNKDRLRDHLKVFLATFLIGWQFREVRLPGSRTVDRRSRAIDEAQEKARALLADSDFFEFACNDLINLMVDQADAEDIDDVLRRQAKTYSALKDPDVRDYIARALQTQPTANVIRGAAKGVDAISMDLDLEETTLAEGLKAFSAKLGYKTLEHLRIGLGRDFPIMPLEDARQWIKERGITSEQEYRRQALAFNRRLRQ